MTVREQAFPFRPASNRTLRPGQFWALPLRDGWYGCGRVLALPDTGGHGSRTMFLAGLIDWFGVEPPSAAAIASAPLLAAGLTHVTAIQETGGMVLGHRPLADDGIELPRYVDAPGPGAGVYEGLRLVGPASREEMRELPSREVWGYLVIRSKAQRRWQDLQAAAWLDA